MAEIYGPADVVAGLVGFLRGHGINAATRVPLERAPGMVRVSRQGGGPVNELQDQAVMLVEVWAEDQPAAFDLARKIWGLVAAVSVNDQGAFPGLVTYRASPNIPVQYPDEYAPELDRHQLTVDMLVRFEPMEVDL
ncbi:hypothetical protein [Actinobaculum sp. 352]|uniref:hypothetical protein n=1 Tax=Actinobaculum sp. 352 TaxID=2490946 RepID=UPI000F7E96FC|nr:hypothetical protein [Actinobaculum sp. 352]RTE50391.1 hypothetical protein EKN07_04125 [Actinobaculum sp. 352]